MAEAVASDSGESSSRVEYPVVLRATVGKTLVVCDRLNDEGEVNAFIMNHNIPRESVEMTHVG